MPDDIRNFADDIGMLSHSLINITEDGYILNSISYYSLKCYCFSPIDIQPQKPPAGFLLKK